MKQSLLFLLFIISTSLSAQLVVTEENRCLSNQWLDAYEASHPGYKDKISQGLKESKNQGSTARNSSMMLTLPVHVIIVHAPGEAIGTGSNFSVEHVQSQIDVINEDFGQYNSDSGNTPPVFPSTDTGIQFCLATVDPDGNPTDGITRHATTTSMNGNGGRTQVISETRWPRDSYMNVWSAPNLSFLGLASLPSTTGLPSPNQDFILVEATSFGGPGYATGAPYDLGRTTTHEIGHWLGCDHPWGGNGGCGNDDGFADTPTQNQSNFGCPNHPSPSCGNSGDMFMNYMDYVNDNCMNAFTEDQADYMNLILSTSRASLPGASATNCSAVVPLTVTVLNQQDPLCFDSSDGFILVEALGGTGPYTYTVNGGAITTDDLFTDLVAGNYTIEATDSNGETSSITVTLNAPEFVQAVALINQTNQCGGDENGIVTINAFGGTGTLSYSINMGPSQNSPVFEELANGFYAYQVTDANGCIFADQFELAGEAPLVIIVDTLIANTCAYDSVGAIEGAASGGIGSLSYSIDGINYQDEAIFENLAADSYTLYVQDGAGCVESTTVHIGGPDPIALSVDITDILCHGGSTGQLSLSASGSNGGPWLHIINEISYGQESVIDSLPAGDYNLMIQDSLGCTLLDTVAISQPDQIILENALIEDSSCFGDEDGSVMIVASGGSGTLTYGLGSAINETGIFTDLLAGNYSIIISDENGCQLVYDTTVGFVSDIEVVVSSVTNPTCSGDSNGSITVTSSGTSGDATYSLDGGSPQPSPVFEGLATGAYTIIVSDATGCNGAVFVEVEEPQELLINIEVVSNVTCFGGNDGQVNVIVSGGTAPYSYDIPFDVLDNPSAGTYDIAVTDDNGCMAVTTFTITQPEEMMVTLGQITPVDCINDEGGSVVATASGGTVANAYGYQLAGNGVVLESQTGLFNDLDYGTYTVTATDDNGCSSQNQVLIPYPSMFGANIANVNPISCQGAVGGSLDLDVVGGSGEYTYLLDNEREINPDSLNTTAGTHTIEVIDVNIGCSILLSFELEEIPALEITYDIDTQTDLITITPSGGTAPYMYSYDGGMTFTSSNTFDLILAGDLEVIVQDHNGCTASTVALIVSTNYKLLLKQVSTFPNPFDNLLTINFELQHPADISIQIFDITGALIHYIPTKKYESVENSVKIDARNFASSIYIVKIASAGDHRYIKVVKM